MKFINNYKASLLFAGLLLINVVVISCESETAENAKPVVPTTRSLNVNLDMNLQTMESFGASDAWQCNFIGKNWPTDKRNHIADLLFSKEVDTEGSPKGFGL